MKIANSRRSAAPDRPPSGRSAHRPYDHRGRPRALPGRRADRRRLRGPRPAQRPADRQQEADQAHAQWLDLDSDFIGWLKLWDFVQKLKTTTTRGQFRKAYQNFLSEMHLREWQDVHRQLLDMAAQFGLKAGKHKYLGPTLPPALGPRRARESHGKPRLRRHSSPPARRPTFQHRQWWRRPNNTQPPAAISSFSGRAAVLSTATKPKWIMAAELVETTRRYLPFTVARIDPDWIEPLAAHFVSAKL